MHKPKATQLPQLASVKALAKASGIPYTSIRDMVFRGELPVVKVGKSDRHAAWYIDTQDFVKAIDSRKETLG